MASEMWQCHYCRGVLTSDTLRKNRLCPNCGSDLHACLNCRLYDEDRKAGCREPNSPWIADRSTANNCPYFDYKLMHESDETQGSGSVLSEAEQAKEAFRALFRSP